MTEKRFSTGIEGGYAELPVEAAWVKWTRGDAKLAQIWDKDPGAYFGGWRASVKSKDDELLPALPLPKVKRVSEDGKHSYEVYASNVISFLPIIGRCRFELRQKVKDEETGREYEKATVISRQRLPGYAPNRQIFGIVYDDKGNFGYAVLVLNKWSAFISFEKAERQWQKVKVPQGKLLVRKYGTVGAKDKASGETIPNFEVFGQSRSTPIEAINIKNPNFVEINDVLNQLYDSAVAWRECPVWGNEGEINETVDQTAKQQALAKIKELRLTDVETEQLLAENDHDWKKVLAAIAPEDGQWSDEDINSQLASADEQP